MKISIVIPSYNQGRYIGRTIESILMQEDSDTEIVVVDGGSKDETTSIVKSFGPSVNFFISEPDGGQSDALMKGMRLVTGQFVGWQNSDDVYAPGAFKSFRRALEDDVGRGEGADVYFGNQYRIDAEDRILNGKRFGPFDVSFLKYVGWNITNQSTFFRRTKLMEIGGVDADLHYAMDFDLYIRLAQAGASFRWVDQYWGALRIHGETKGAQWGDVRMREYKELRSRFITGYNPEVPFSEQFKLRRFMLYAARCFWFLRSGILPNAVAEKFFPDRDLLKNALETAGAVRLAGGKSS